MSRLSEIRTYADMRAQIEPERLLAARRSAEAAREARFRKLPTPAQAEPAPQASSDPSLPRMLAGVALALAAWALFAWAVVAAVEAVRAAS